MLPIDPNYTKSKSHGNNCDKSSCDNDKVGDEKGRSDNLEDLE